MTALSSGIHTVASLARYATCDGYSGHTEFLRFPEPVTTVALQPTQGDGIDSRLPE